MRRDGERGGKIIVSAVLCRRRRAGETEDEAFRTPRTALRLGLKTGGGKTESGFVPLRDNQPDVRAERRGVQQVFLPVQAFFPFLRGENAWVIEEYVDVEMRREPFETRTRTGSAARVVGGSSARSVGATTRSMPPATTAHPADGATAPISATAPGAS